MCIKRHGVFPDGTNQKIFFWYTYIFSHLFFIALVFNKRSDSEPTTRQPRAICVWNGWAKYELRRCKMKPEATHERTQFSEGLQGATQTRCNMNIRSRYRVGKKCVLKHM